MDKDLRMAPNQKYINIVRQIVDQQFQPKLIDWASRISEQHKKGLHVIKTIVDLRGLKRFKKNTAENDITSSDIMSDVRNQSNAKEIFRRMTVQSAYARQFGETPKKSQEFTVLKQKPLIKLPCAQVLKPNIAQMLSRWLAMNDQDKFTERIFYAVREMYTCVKN